MVGSKADTLRKLKEHLNRRETRLLSPHATLTMNAVRRIREPRLEQGHRQDFAVDSDRILHSLAYTRYIDKTQVFYLVDNDHITHRVLHVQLVSKISRTIGRFLGLNEDLIEAIALGHDIGHCPFGHDGEKFLSTLCEKAGIGPYLHNVQSVRFLEKIERKGRGLNLTLQVLDGIVCHDGEIHTQALRPETGKRFLDFDRQVHGKVRDPSLALSPMTMEGCVVRMADTISYIGRDIEDAIRLGLIRRDQIPQECVTCLGNTNGTIVYNLVTDLIANSLDQAFIAFSDELSAALRVLRDFNLEAIYQNPKIKPQTGKISSLFERLFEQYLNDLEQGNESSIIFSQYLKGMEPLYRESTAPAEIVRDFIAGMTDAFFLKQFPKELRPKRLHSTFSGNP